MKKLLLIIIPALIIWFNNYTFCQDGTDIKIENIIKQLTIQEKIRLLDADDTISIDRLNIPSYDWHNECLHGVIARNATIFPQAIALSATWDINLMYKVSTAISDEARILNRKIGTGLNFWSPNLNLCRDPRWGRCQETYGEDPFLLSSMAYSFITGLQGDDPKYLKAIASPKHYVVHSGPEGSRHTFNAISSQYDFRNSYLTGFKSAITKAKTYSVMIAYNAVNDSAIAATYNLLNGILREELGLQGFIVTDCGALGDAFWAQHCVQNIADAPGLFLKCGVDMECGQFWAAQLYSSIKKGKAQESQIDTALKRLFRSRFKLGLFDSFDAVKYNFIPDSLLNSYTHFKLAENAAEKSIVLLKNINNTLPLKKDIKNLFVVGPLANVFADLWGNYATWQDSTVRILAGIQKKVSDSTKVRYEKAIELVGYMTETLANYSVKTNNGEPGFDVQYYNNMFLSGEPAFTQIENKIEFNRDKNKLPANFPVDSFSIRYTGNLQVLKTKEYSFLLGSDDGAILILNGDTLINDWSPHGFRNKNAIIRLNEDSVYSLIVEYYEKKYDSKLLCALGNDETIDYDLLKMLNDTASASDAIIFVGGINYGLESEESHLDIDGFYKGDRTNINLPITQTKILKSLKESGKPLILVLIGGSCLAINWENENLDAIIQAWYPGQAGGNAVANVLFGDYNPAARLPITYYRTADDLPVFENYDMTGRTYRYFNKPVLYPFGYGLSYSTFEYSSLIVPNNIIDACKTDTINIIFKIKNASNYDGDEVPQLYLKNLDSKISREIKSLKGFNRINIKAGEQISDTIRLLSSDLTVFDTLLNKYDIESGRYKVEIGANSSDIRLTSEINIISCASNSIDASHDIDVIYPNPSDNFVKFQLNSIPFGNYSFSIVNINGEKVNQFNKNINNSDILTLDVANLSQGVYVLEISNGKNKYYKNFVINR